MFISVRIENWQIRLIDVQLRFENRKNCEINSQKGESLFTQIWNHLSEVYGENIKTESLPMFGREASILSWRISIGRLKRVITVNNSEIDVWYSNSLLCTIEHPISSFFEFHDTDFCVPRKAMRNHKSPWRFSRSASSSWVGVVKGVIILYTCYEIMWVLRTMCGMATTFDYFEHLQ